MRNLLHIEPGEGRKVFVLFSYIFFVVALGIVGKAARDSYFLSRYNKSLLPIMLVGCAVSVVVAVTLYTWLSKRLGERTLFYASNALFALSLPLISLRLQGWLIPFLYLWIDVVTEICGMQYWMLAVDVFNPRQAKRLFGPIGTGSAIAGMVVGLGLKPFIQAFGSGALLYLATAMLAASWGIAVIASRYAQPAAKTARPAPARPAKTARRLDPYLGSIALVISLGAIASLLVDYQFKMVAARSFTNEGSLASFFGMFYALTGAASLVVQLALSSFLLSRYGVLAGLLVLPALLNLGSIAILLRATLASALFTKSNDQTFKYTLNRTALELLWLPVPARRRQTMKPFITSSVKSMAEAAAGLATFFLVKVLPLESLSVIVIAATGGWIAGAFRLKSLYVQALERAIEKQQIDFEELSVDVKDPAMVAVIERALASGDAIQQLFVLDLIAGLSLAPWADTLQRLLLHGPAEVRMRILALAGRDAAVVPEETLQSLLGEQDSVAARAVLAIGERRLDRLMPRLETLLDSNGIGTRLAAAAVMLSRRQGAADRARTMLAAALESPADAERTAALELLAGDSELLTTTRLRQCLGSESGAVRDAALTVAARRADATLIPAVVALLESPGSAAQSRSALRSFPPADVREALAAALRRPGMAPQRKMGLVRALRDYPDEAAAALALEAIERDSLPLMGEIADTLIAIARHSRLDDKIEARLVLERGHLLRAAYAENRTLCLLPEYHKAFLLREAAETAIGCIVPLVLKLAGVARPHAPIETCIQIVRSREAGRLPFVLEFLDSVFDRGERELVDPLIEPLEPAERDQSARPRFADLPSSLEQVLDEAARSPDEWRSAIALEYRKEQTAAMHSTLEKTIFLKSVDLFGRIPAETLSRVAQVTEEREFAAGTTIFHDGDAGSSMFIVVDGAVEIHKGGRELSVLRKGACFGEMSLLDAAPRSADATTREDSTLYEISEESFYEVMGGHVEIAQGIIRMLAERLRNVNRKLAESVR